MKGEVLRVENIDDNFEYVYIKYARTTKKGVIGTFTKRIKRAKNARRGRPVCDAEVYEIRREVVARWKEMNLEQMRAMRAMMRGYIGAPVPALRRPSDVSICHELENLPDQTWPASW
jgi:hypothetical protein